MPLKEFEFEIKYKKGRENVNADALLRTVCYTELEIIIKIKEIYDDQRKDDKLKSVIESVRTNKWPEKHNQDIFVKRMYPIRNQLLLIDGVIYRQTYTFNTERMKTIVPVIPTIVTESIIRNCHDSKLAGHFSYIKTIGKILDIAYWPGM